MKFLKIVLLLIVSNISIIVFSQTLDDDLNNKKNYIEVKLDIKGFSLIERWAMYPDGEEGIINHIINNLRYPREAQEDSIVGRVVVSYVVETDGTVGEIEVIQSVHPILDEEAMRVFRKMQKWKPAIQNGEPVKVAYQQVFNFNL